ncbi:MAG TPA: hypothetical protein VMH80_00490 [Bryobacteraceae bacterium]|nr:hypothetical protein [Bryobacteraceae bacterium]
MPNGRQLLAEPVSQSVFSEAAAQSSQPREWAAHRRGVTFDNDNSRLVRTRRDQGCLIFFSRMNNPT